MENTILNIQFDLNAPPHMTEDDVSNVIKYVLGFVENNAHVLSDDNTLDRFLDHCKTSNYYMPLVHQITSQIFEAMYGPEMMAEIGEHGYAKKPTVN